MRFCRNEQPSVYEAMNADLPALLREVANQIEDLAEISNMVNIFPYVDDNGDHLYIAHLYVS